MSTPSRLISVVVPVHQGAPVLGRCLEAIVASDLPRDGLELVVVDDASTDGSAVVAGQYADIVVRLTGQPRGPAYARNRGVELARGDVIASVDADVCVHPDALRRMLERLDADPTLAAVVGSYDATDVGRDVVSDHRNLLHAYLRTRAAGDVDAYWPACGAVRRQVLTAIGPFDEWHYSRPQAEGAELGRRMRRAGHRILLDPAIEATHLKRWTLVGSVRTDLMNHCLPWMRLLVHERSLTRMRTPNLSAREKVNAASTMSTLMLLALHWRWPSAVPTTFATITGAALLLGCAPFFLFAIRHRGPIRAAEFVPLQLVHYVVAAIALITGWLLHQVIGEPRRDVRDDALAEVGLQTWPPVPRRLPTDVWHAPPSGRVSPYPLPRAAGASPGVE